MVLKYCLVKENTNINTSTCTFKFAKNTVVNNKLYQQKFVDIICLSFLTENLVLQALITNRIILSLWFGEYKLSVKWAKGAGQKDVGPIHMQQACRFFFF